MVEFVTKFDMFKRKDQAVNLTYQVFREQRDDGVGITDKLKMSSPVCWIFKSNCTILGRAKYSMKFIVQMLAFWRHTCIVEF